jgi:hypothetical protein
MSWRPSIKESILNTLNSPLEAQLQHDLWNAGVVANDPSIDALNSASLMGLQYCGFANDVFDLIF